MNMRRLIRWEWLFGVILPAILAVQIFGQNGPPKAAVRNVTDEYFGQKIVDPYRFPHVGRIGLTGQT